MATTVRYVVRYSGNVQGVGFRMTAVALARDLKVGGFIRNEPDGSVQLDVDGPEATIKALLGRIRSAMGQRIDDVVIDVRPTKDRSDGLRIEH